MPGWRSLSSRALPSPEALSTTTISATTSAPVRSIEATLAETSSGVR
jgi:hypothetical protein